MAMIAVWLKLDEVGIAQALHVAQGRLSRVEGEVALDFSSVRRVQPETLRAMEQFVELAEQRRISVVLRDVSIGVYKVLKQARLASRFSFAG